MSLKTLPLIRCGAGAGGRVLTAGGLLGRVGVGVGLLVGSQGVVQGGVSREWAAAVDGSWTVAGNWLPAGVPGESETAVLGLRGGYTVAFPGNNSVGGLVIENPEASLAINAGRTLSLFGDALNDGTIVVNTTGITLTSALQAAESVSIDGSGMIVLNGPSGTWARLGAADGAMLTIGAEQTVRIDGGRVFGSVVNNGTIDSQAADLSGSEILNTVDQTGGGVIRGLDGFARLVSATVTGGSFDSDGTGVVTASGSGNAWSGIANLGSAALEAGATVALLDGGLVNDGTVTINRSSITLVTALQATESASITGAGTIVLNGSSSTWARLGSVEPAVLTIGAEQTVLISGGRLFGSIDHAGEIISQASEIDGSEIIGTIDQSAGGVIRGEDGFVRLLSATIIGGSFDSSGAGVVTAGNANNMWDGVTNLGAAALEAGGTVSLGGGGLENNGSVTINRNAVTLTTALQTSESALISGTGTIVLNGPNLIWARIGSVGEGVLTLGAGQTLTGNRGRTVGVVECAGTLAPSGTGGEIEIQGSFSFLAGGVLRIGLESEVGVPRLSGLSTGQVGLANGSLVIADEGFAPAAFFRASIVQGPTYAGRFVDLEGPALPGGRVWRVLYVNATTIDIAATCPADLNADGIVDADDLGILLSSFGNQVVTPYSSGDTNGDGLVDADDLGNLLAAFGSNC